MSGAAGDDGWRAPTLYCVPALARALGWTESTTRSVLLRARRSHWWAIDRVVVDGCTMFGSGLAARAASRGEGRPVLVCAVAYSRSTAVVRCKTEANSDRERGSEWVGQLVAARYVGMSGHESVRFPSDSAAAS